MTFYSVILFLHVLAAMTLIAAISHLVVSEAGARRARTPIELRGLWDKQQLTRTIVKSMVPVLLATGLYMAYSAWSLRAAWVIVALVTFSYLAISGPVVHGRRMHRAVEMATTAGSINADVRRLLNDPLMAMLKDVRVALLTLIVFLMTTKPGIEGTVVATLLALAIGAARGLVWTRIHAPVATTRESQ